VRRKVTGIEKQTHLSKPEFTQFEKSLEIVVVKRFNTGTISGLGSTLALQPYTESWERNTYYVVNTRRILPEDRYQKQTNPAK
jgi:hypothetical protein